MADAFQPRFVDLVRNYTTTSGTDDFVLSAVLNGFRSFTDALQVGDNFYYSAAGIDNPGDTEVGRGTLLSGGVVSREPLSGAKTNFKKGTIAVALVAASEWFERIDSSTTSVRSFGAKGDSDAGATTGTDDTAAFQAAIDALGATGGGILTVPDGYYRIDASYLTLCANLRIVMSPAAFLVTGRAGGGGASLDEDVRNGSMFFSNWPSNASNGANITIEGGNIVCANSANVGAAFYDNCGGNIKIQGVAFHGFKYGVIFDQTELADVLDCNFQLPNDGGACVWLVNADILKAGNIGQFTNRVGVHRCQLNAGATVDLIRDDGGYTHVFAHNNYNGGLDQIRLAGAAGFTIHGGEFEAAAGNPISFDNVASDGSTGVGPGYGAMYGGFITGSVRGGGGGQCSFFGTQFMGGQIPVVSATNCYWKFYGCGISNADRQYVDDDNCRLLIDDAPNIIKSIGLRAWQVNNDHVNAWMQCTNASANLVTIPPDDAYGYPFPIGSFFMLEQMSATGPVSFVAGDGVSLTGALATNSQHQRIRAVRVAANSWRIELIVPDPLEGSRNLADLPDPEAARNNLDVYSKEQVDGAISGLGGGTGGTYVKTPTSWTEQITAAKALGGGTIVAQGATQISHTGDTNEAILASITLPANSMGANGCVVIEALWSQTNNSNTKTQRIKFGNSLVFQNVGSTQAGAQTRYRISNRNSANSQVTTAFGFISVYGSGGASTLAVDTTQDVVIAITGQLASAADAIALESYQALVYPKD